MHSLKAEDPQAEFRFFGGDMMAAEGGTMVKHYRELAYMGFVPVLLHLPTILRNMRRCKQDIVNWQPDVVIVNAGGNKFHVGGHVIMHIPDVLKTMDYAPKATFVATHLEGVNHNHVTRAALLQAAREHGVAGRVHIPEDGESVNVSK